MKYTEEQIKEFANNQYNKKSIEHRNLKQAYTEGFKKAIELVNSSNVIPDVSDFYYLKNGDEIQKGDEYRDEERDWKWFPTGQVGKKYRSGYHYKHRRKI